MSKEIRFLQLFPDDLKEHIEITRQHSTGVLDNGELKTIVISDCSCTPKIEYQESGDVIVVHNSFDGRENFEWDSKVREN